MLEAKLEAKHDVDFQGTCKAVKVMQRNALPPGLDVAMDALDSPSPGQCRLGSHRASLDVVDKLPESRIEFHSFHEPL